MQHRRSGLRPPSRPPSRLLALPALAAALAFGAAPAGAQGFLRKLAGATMDMAMRTAPVTDLESRGLPTLAVGGLQLGASKIAVRDTTALRLQVYLFNPGQAAVTVPAPDRSLFALVDDRGRRLTLVSGPRIERHAGGPLTVPAMERVGLVFFFNGLGADAQTVTLKVGAVGMIPGIPLRGEAGGGAAAGAGGTSVWTRPAGGEEAKPSKVTKQVPAEPAEAPKPAEPAEPEEPAGEEKPAEPQPAAPATPKPPPARR